MTVATYNENPRLAMIEDNLWRDDRFLVDALYAFPELGIVEAVEAAARAIMDEQWRGSDE
jgi:hypothetical protein